MIEIEIQTGGEDAAGIYAVFSTCIGQAVKLSQAVTARHPAVSLNDVSVPGIGIVDSHQIVNLGNINGKIGEQEQSILQPAPTMWYWDENSKKSFEECLKNEEIRAKLNEISNFSDGNRMARGK